MLVYLDGEYVPHEEARVSVDDRGFLFADGIYEVVRVYDGRPFLMDAHIERMRRGLGELKIPFEGFSVLGEVAARLLDENDLRSGDASIYMQVTRGAAPRKHSFPPEGVEPTVYVAAKRFEQHPPAYFRDGVPAITVPDNRWGRCDVKSIALLPNVLANQQAKAADAFEALFVRDGIVVEGSHSNLFAVRDGTLVTYPESNYILPGITRSRVIELAKTLEIPFEEGLVPYERLFEVDELFLSGTTTEVMPVVRVDGRAIGEGEPGPVTRRLQQAYREAILA